MIGAAVLIAAALGATAPVRADADEDFYHGRTLRMLIGYGPAGGYDLYGRIVAEFLSRHWSRLADEMVRQGRRAGSVQTRRGTGRNDVGIAPACRPTPQRNGRSAPTCYGTAW